MPKILIIARHNDPHSYAVLLGLKEMGCEPTVWYWEDFPKFDSISALIREDTNNKNHISIDFKYSQQLSVFDVIWIRRRGEPSAIDGSHPDDIEIINQESKLFFRNILPLLGHSKTRWVNHPDAEHKAMLKTTQLHAASRVGFRIPETMIGNNAEGVRQFLIDHPNGVVHKSLHSHTWINDEGSVTVSRTSRITLSQLKNDFLIRACPSIYQEEIEKKHELRVTVMGDVVLASMIDSQHGVKTVDWRYDGGRGRTNLTLTEIEPEIAERCQSLCRSLQLEFGCIDLIVTPQNEIVFLEINCAGQFLFNELVDPRIPMLDTFCRFLIYGNTSDPNIHRKKLRFENFTSAIKKKLNNNS